MFYPRDKDMFQTGYNVLIRICYVTQHLAIHDNKQCYVHEFK